jgi:hypothetical protein
MNRFIRCGLAAALYPALMPVVVATPAFAHGYAGKRFFPATITTDDPFVADELSLPTVLYIKNNDEPSAKETEVSAEFSKRILDNLGLSFEEAWTHLDRPHEQNKSGFQNLETTAKYQFLTNAEREAIVSAGLGVEWGDTGARKVDADSFSTLTPTLFFGKGAGDLPESLSLARPLALTGLIGYAVPTSGRNTKTSVDPDTGEIERNIDHHPTKLVMPLGFVLAGARRPASKLWASLARNALSRFSQVGMFAVALLLATGIVNSSFLIGSVETLLGTLYGNILLVKICLFTIMVSLALTNRLCFMPRIKASPSLSG